MVAAEGRLLLHMQICSCRIDFCNLETGEEEQDLTGEPAKPEPNVHTKKQR